MVLIVEVKNSEPEMISKLFQFNPCPQQDAQTRLREEISAAPRGLCLQRSRGESSHHHCQLQNKANPPKPLLSAHRGKKECADPKSPPPRFTSYSLIVPFHVQPSLIQTAGRLSTSRRAALSGKACSGKGRRAQRSLRGTNTVRPLHSSLTIPNKNVKQIKTGLLPVPVATSSEAC